MKKLLGLVAGLAICIGFVGNISAATVIPMNKSTTEIIYTANQTRIGIVPCYSAVEATVVGSSYTYRVTEKTNKGFQSETSSYTVAVTNLTDEKVGSKFRVRWNAIIRGSGGVINRYQEMYHEY